MNMDSNTSSTNKVLADFQEPQNDGNDSGIMAQDHQQEHLDRYNTNGSVAIPMEVFEKMYLNPQMPVKGELRKTFGNPTPL
jgi:uncharacterized protein